MLSYLEPLSYPLFQGVLYFPRLVLRETSPHFFCVVSGEQLTHSTEHAGNGIGNTRMYTLLVG